MEQLLKETVDGIVTFEHSRWDSYVKETVTVVGQLHQDTVVGTGAK